MQCVGLQSVFTRQRTHRPLSGLQRGAAPPQSVSVVHWTHTPVALQTGRSIPTQSAFDSQRGSQEWVSARQTRISGQSAEVIHSKQRPVATSQNGALPV